MAYQFDPQVIREICSYMNSEPMNSVLAIAQFNATDKKIDQANLVSFDGEGCEFEITSEGNKSILRVSWFRPIDTRPEIKEQLLALYQSAY